MTPADRTKGLAEVLLGRADRKQVCCGEYVPGLDMNVAGKSTTATAPPAALLAAINLYGPRRRFRPRQVNIGWNGHRFSWPWYRSLDRVQEPRTPPQHPDRAAGRHR